MRIGLDIGGTKTDAVLVGPAGDILHEVRFRTGSGPRQVLDTAATAVAHVCGEAGIGSAAIASVGVGVPGTVDVERGHVRHAVNLGIETLDLGALLGQRLGLPVRVENDVNAAALGAFSLLGGPASSPDSMAYLNLGTGLACGVVLRGELWRGSRAVAGEIGHFPVDPSGQPCACGQRGCLETVCSGSAIARMWPVPAGPPAVQPAALPAAQLFAAAAAGHSVAREVQRTVCAGVAAAVRLIALAVDVDRVVLGGGISRIGAPLLEQVREHLRTAARTSEFIDSLDLPRRVQLAPPGPDPAALGAALVGAEVLPGEERVFRRATVSGVGAVSRQGAPG